jgi:hypothetical protein
MGREKRTHNLATVLVNDVASILDAALEHTVGGRVGDHERGEVILVLFSLELEIVEVEETGRVDLDGNDLHAGHNGTLWSRRNEGQLRIVGGEKRMEELKRRIRREEGKRRMSTHSRVGAVCADGNEADAAVTFVAAEVVGADDGETSVLALSSRVGLKRTAGKTGHLGEVVSEFL